MSSSAGFGASYSSVYIFLGLLVGRDLRVMKRYNAIMAGKQAVTETPPNVPLL